LIFDSLHSSSFQKQLEFFFKTFLDHFRGYFSSSIDPFCFLNGRMAWKKEKENVFKFQIRKCKWDPRNTALVLNLNAMIDGCFDPARASFVFFFFFKFQIKKEH